MWMKFDPIALFGDYSFTLKQQTRFGNFRFWKKNPYFFWPSEHMPPFSILPLVLQRLVLTESYFEKKEEFKDEDSELDFPFWGLCIYSRILRQKTNDLKVWETKQTTFRFFWILTFSRTHRWDNPKTWIFGNIFFLKNFPWGFLVFTCVNDIQSTP